MRAFPVTVVIPAYNSEDYLDETVKSAVQAGPEKVIIVNDGSTDSTLKKALNLKSSFDIVELYSKENGGESSAINFGLSKATSKFVLFLSADDLIARDLLEKTTAALEQDPSLVVAYPSWNIIDALGRITEVVGDINFSYRRLLADLECLPGPGSVIRASALGSGRVVGMTQMGDFEQWIRLSAKGSFLHIDEALASWRKHDSNMSLNSFGFNNSSELDIIKIAVEETVEILNEDQRQQIKETFYTTWNKLKAISEIRVPGSFLSIKYMFRSLVLKLKHRSIRLRRPWTPQEFLACLFPSVARKLIIFSSPKVTAFLPKG